MEEHHQKLHQILKHRSSHPIARTEQNPKSDLAAKPAQADRAPKPVHSPVGHSSSQAESSLSSEQTTHQSSPAPPASQQPWRNVSTSIASNLASARGIPSSQRRRGEQVPPALSPDQAGGRILNSLKRKEIDTARQARNEDLTQQYIHRNSSKNTKQQDLVESSPKNAPSGTGAVADAGNQGVPGRSSDEPFQRFYSTFENLISKLSAPLAFAGLPLAGEEPPPEKIPTNEKARTHETVTAGPDLNRIFSKSALRAVKDASGPSSLGTGGESFYVVPTTGGTISYAGILSRAEQDRHIAAGGRLDDLREHVYNDEEPEFVDARETPQPPSPTRTRQGSLRTWRYGTKSRPRAGSASTKTVEELQIENQALKQLSDTLSRRLHMWEVNAQSSSMALQQSLRALQRSPAASDAGKSAADDYPEKVKELEDHLQVTKRELERVGRENEKLKIVVGRYREKWEKLKEGARMRREGSKGEETAKPL